MKKGILIKEGKYWKVKSIDSNTTMNVPGDFGLSDDMEGQEIDFDTTGGPIRMIQFKGVNYSKKVILNNPKTDFKNHQNYDLNKERRNYNHSANHANKSIGNARAPYNFVSINDHVVKSQFSPEEIRFNTYNKDGLSGTILVDIESLTPIYIRGMKPLTADQPEKTAEFFKGKDYCIPGSSLRGLLRTMTEIVSYSKMGSINRDTLTKRFHYRAFADQSLTLRDEYAIKMIKKEGKPEYYYPSVKSGIIKRQGKNYVIYEGLHFKVEEDLAFDNGILTEKMSFYDNDREKYQQNRRYKNEFKTVYYKASSETVHHHSKDLKYAKVTDIRNSPSPSLSKGYIVCTGWMVGPGKGIKSRGKHMHWVIGEINYSKGLQVPEDVVSNYINDSARNGMDLISKLKDKNIEEVPCFFITNNDGITSFGHTGMFRLAYEKTLIEFFPDGHRVIDQPDFTELLFGKNDVVSSRVFVEDAYAFGAEPSAQIKIPAIMGSPKPTTFQHYLKQNTGQVTSEYNRQGKLSGFRGLNDYNQETVVNGNKLYWHQKNVEYPAAIEIKTDSLKRFLTEKGLINRFRGFEFQHNRTVIKINNLTPEQYDAIIQFNLSQKDAQHTAIRPMLQNVKFEGQIRFENLTRIELGALLFTLFLPDDLCLKIGLGKGLGFGSIKIKANVNVTNREERYSDLLSEWTGVINSKPNLKQNEIDELIKDFEHYILSNIGSSFSSLWEEKRLIELKTMLDFKNQVAGDKAKYMMIEKWSEDENGRKKKENEYKYRPILQNPSEYIKKP